MSQITIILSPQDRRPLTNQDWAQALMILSVVLKDTQAVAGNDPFEAGNAATGVIRRYNMSWSTDR